MAMKTMAATVLAILVACSSYAAFAADNKAGVWVLKSVRVPANDDIAEVSQHASQKDCQAAAKQYDKTHPGRKAGCFKK
jgi:hypothetical protein